MLYADKEASPEVYGAAADRQQASIVFDVAKQMVEMTPALLKRSKIRAATKRIVNYRSAGFYQVLSADVHSKHGLSVSGLVFDELHTQPNRKLYDVLTKGSGDAREQPLYFLITTAGTDRESICYELHQKAVDILNGRKNDPTFYPVVYGLNDDDDWNDEKCWYKANPSLGYTISIERVRDMYKEAIENPAEENVFKQLRLNMWVSGTTRFIPEHVYDQGSDPIDEKSLLGRECYGGLDLSSTGDITALVLMFPPRDENEKYVLLPFFWIPEDTIPIRTRRASVPYDVWHKKGYLNATEGNVVHYGFIQKFIEDLRTKYDIKEIAYDRWNATQLIQNLTDEEFVMVPFGQGFKDMSAATKEFYKLLMERKIQHGGNPIMRWMAGNIVVDIDPAGNIKPTKARSAEKIDGIVAAIMALDRAVRHEKARESVYNDRGLLIF
ncbi:MAG: terminase large subunit [Synergistaceae bacterium]|nr:terminase large subunit [Synergistaceae bacterium]